MSRPMNIFLIRHGESEANLDKSVNARIADHKIPLSDDGKRQAEAAGVALRRFLEANRRDWQHAPFRLWRSPYLRTRQTTDGIMNGLSDEFLSAISLTDIQESLFLRELQFGLFDGIPDDELPQRFPQEHAYYERYKAFGGEIYVPMPMGESRVDVAQRVHQFFGTIQRDAERHGITNLIVVTHGVTLRAFVMQWCHHSVEWMEDEPNPANCAIRFLSNGEDRGYIFSGFPSKYRLQDRREEGKI